MVELTSTLDNRYGLVKDGTHRKCGPNTIRSDATTAWCDFTIV
ncbi:hypothetical protein [Nodosilinea sp. E11]|nr:hypothetical protein [Nodosilinea sp. E11]WOD39794.1 hypothetical protein RRF56_03160 [Nodosilinea sp. E11]